MTVAQLVEKYPDFYWTWRLIIVIKMARHVTLSWTSRILSASSHSISLRSTWILSSIYKTQAEIKKSLFWIDIPGGVNIGSSKTKEKLIGATNLN
jgi:hypothetical protein